MSNSHELELNQNNHLSLNADAFRAPQLNPRVRGHGGTSQGLQDVAGEDDNGDTDIDFISDLALLYKDYEEEDDANGDSAEHVFGQEGVEENQAGTPECRCSCHQGPWMARHPLLDTSPPSCSGMHSVTSSRLAEYDGSDDHSLENSVVLSPPSPSPSEFDVFIRSLWIDDRAFEPTPLLRFSLVYNPLALNPELGFARNMDRPVYYQTNISIHDETEGEDEGRSLSL